MEPIKVPIRGRRRSDAHPGEVGLRQNFTFTVAPEKNGGDLYVACYHDHFVMTNTSAALLGKALLEIANATAHLAITPFVEATHVISDERRSYERRAVSVTFNAATNSYVLSNAEGEVLDSLPAPEWTVSLGGI